VVEVKGKRLVLGGAQANLGGGPSAGIASQIVLTADGVATFTSGTINGKAALHGRHRRHQHRDGSRRGRLPPASTIVMAHGYSGTANGAVPAYQLSLGMVASAMSRSQRQCDRGPGTDEFHSARQQFLRAPDEAPRTTGSRSTNADRGAELKVSASGRAVNPSESHDR
jgi:hypothetical protein